MNGKLHVALLSVFVTTLKYLEKNKMDTINEYYSEMTNTYGDQLAYNNSIPQLNASIYNTCETSKHNEEPFRFVDL
jgi:hypothetical protein